MSGVLRILSISTRLTKSVPGILCIGVVSGVGMLFVEMILFVIRTHEFDAVMTKKKRKRAATISPFGHTQRPKEIDKS